MSNLNNGYGVNDSFISILHLRNYPKNSKPSTITVVEPTLADILHSLYDIQEDVINLFQKQHNITLDLTFFPVYKKVPSSEQLVWQVTASWGDTFLRDPDVTNTRDNKKYSYYLFDEPTNTTEAVLRLFDKIAKDNAPFFINKTTDDNILKIIHACIELRDKIFYFCAREHTKFVI